MASAILTYHSIDTSGSVISTSPAVFQSHLEILSASSIRVVPLSRIQDESGCVAITFDDGFENFEVHALPQLLSRGFPATVFLVSGYCGGHNDWPTQSPSAPRMPLLSWRAMQRITCPAIEWGAHTVSHPDLTKLSHAAMSGEISGCKMAIEQNLGSAVASLAYPYGAWNSASKLLAAAEFALACGTRLDFLNSEEHTFELPRIDAYYLRNPVWLKRLLKPSGLAYIRARRALREARSWLFQ